MQRLRFRLAWRAFSLCKLHSHCTLVTAIGRPEGLYGVSLLMFWLGIWVTLIRGQIMLLRRESCVCWLVDPDMCPSVCPWTRVPVRDATLLARVSPLKGRLASGTLIRWWFEGGGASRFGETALTNPAAEALPCSLLPSRFRAGHSRWRSDLSAPAESSVHILDGHAHPPSWTGHRSRMR